MLVVCDDRLTAHLAGSDHPEHPDRVRVVARELERLERSIVNVPLPVGGITTEAFAAMWTHTLRTLARSIRPDLLVVSAGYDFVAGDPIGDLGVALSAARRIGRIVREIAVEYCRDRALFVLEGGYDPATLATCVVETIRGFEEGPDVERFAPTAIPRRQRDIYADLEPAHAGLRV